MISEHHQAQGPVQYKNAMKHPGARGLMRGHFGLVVRGHKAWSGILDSQPDSDTTSHWPNHLTSFFFYDFIYYLFWEREKTHVRGGEEEEAER